MGLKQYFLLALWPACFFVAPAQVITTIAGNGTYGYSGDGGPATSAQLHWPTGIAADNLGNVYVADHDNNVIRKVNSAGIITTFAGTGEMSYTGDGGPATAAKLYHPAWVTTDNAGNVYYLDQSEALRKIDLAGIITTVVDLLPDGYSGDGGPLTAARFMNIAGIAFDNAGNMYLSDFDNGTIRKVNTAGIISAIAGTGTLGYSGDGGIATDARLNEIAGITVDNVGNVYVLCRNIPTVRKISNCLAAIISQQAAPVILCNSGNAVGEA